MLGLVIVNCSVLVPETAIEPGLKLALIVGGRTAGRDLGKCAARCQGKQARHRYSEHESAAFHGRFSSKSRWATLRIPRGRGVSLR